MPKPRINGPLTGPFGLRPRLAKILLNGPCGSQDIAGSRAAPQFQHAANCPSDFSPQTWQVQGPRCSEADPKQVSRISQAFGKSSSFKIHISGWKGAPGKFEYRFSLR